MLHGRENAEQAAETARKTFEEGALSDNLAVDRSAKDRPGSGHRSSLADRACRSRRVERRSPSSRSGVVPCASTTRAFRIERKLIGSGELTADGVIKLSLGKKKHMLVRPA